MKRILFLLISLMWVAGLWGRSYCTVENYDESNGLSQRLVKGIVQDRQGLIWVATWNGLNRFDGREFTTIRPGIADEAYKYSSRIGELKLSGDGNLLMRVDDRLMQFDVRSYKFADYHSAIERKLGRKFLLKRIMATDTRTVVLECKEGDYITLADGTPDGEIRVSGRMPELNYISAGNRKLGDVGPYKYDSVVLSRMDASGGIRLITSDGKVVTAPSLSGPYSEEARIEPFSGKLFYSLTDNQGNVWLRSESGIHKVTFGEVPYLELNPARPSMVRVSMKDSKGRIWMSESESKAVAVTDSTFNNKRYLRPDGALTDNFAEFGHGIYSMTESSDGRIWLGSKPDGLFVLNPQGSGFRVDKAAAGNGNVYDIMEDSRGRIWIATMGGGIECIDDDNAGKPVFRRLMNSEGYPEDAKSVRHLAIVGDTMLLAATTSGLLALDIARPLSERLRCSLITSRPGDVSSLGNIAVMDVMAMRDGMILVATESDGVNAVMPGAIDRPDTWRFTHFNASNGLTDVGISLAQTGDASDEALVVSNNKLFLLNPLTGESKAYDDLFTQRNIRFSEGRPLRVTPSRWLLGHDRGAVVLDRRSLDAAAYVPPVMFTGASVEAGRDSVLSVFADTLIMNHRQRNLTLTFAALDYVRPQSHRFSYCIDGRNWIDMGSSRSLILLDLKPGTYRVSVRASTSSGQWADNAASLTVIVVPAWWETVWAKVAYVLMALLLAWGVVHTVRYIRNIKRKQHEILRAYMQLLEATPAEAAAESIAEEDEPAVSSLVMDEADKEFMDTVMTFVNSRMGDSSVSVDDMAAALAMSRSSLNRKIKQLTGLSPAEFMRESRLSHAAMMLSSTSKPVKEIAFDCGFTDLNYFGKCFKSSRGVTPSAFRKSQ